MVKDEKEERNMDGSLSLITRKQKGCAGEEGVGEEENL